MAKTIVSKIKGYAIHDSESVHGLIPNASSYSIQIANPSSSYSEIVEVGIPTDLSKMIQNLTTDLFVKDSSDSDIECYSKVQMDNIIDIQNASINDYNHEIGMIPDFDPYQTYTLNQLVKYNGDYYRCIVNQTSGGWISSHWRVTSIVNEILDIRGVQTTTEKLVIHASFNKGEGVITGQTATIFFDSSSGKQTDTTPFSEEGIAVFFIDYGYRYTISVSDVSGYKTPTTSTIYTANRSQRDVNLQYRQLGSGVFIIDNAGIETDYELWDPADNPNARFVKLTNNVLNPGGSSPDNSVIISVHYASQMTSKTWQIESRDMPTLPIASGNDDLNGQENFERAYRDCNVTQDASGFTFVQKYNNDKGTSITVNEYIPAFMHCYNTTETFLGVEYHAYLPAMGQLRQLCDNRSAVNEALSKLGRYTINISSGHWWSSSESSSGFAWSLFNGHTYNDYKSTSYQVLPLFAL